MAKPAPPFVFATMVPMRGSELMDAPKYSCPSPIHTRLSALETPMPLGRHLPVFRIICVSAIILTTTAALDFVEGTQKNSFEPVAKRASAFSWAGSLHANECQAVVVTAADALFTML